MRSAMGYSLRRPAMVWVNFRASKRFGRGRRDGRDWHVGKGWVIGLWEDHQNEGFILDWRPCSNQAAKDLWLGVTRLVFGRWPRETADG